MDSGCLRTDTFTSREGSVRKFSSTSGEPRVSSRIWVRFQVVLSRLLSKTFMELIWFQRDLKIEPKITKSSFTSGIQGNSQDMDKISFLDSTKGKIKVVSV